MKNKETICIYNTRILEFGLGNILITQANLESLTDNTSIPGLVLEEVIIPGIVGERGDTSIEIQTKGESIILVFHSLEGALALKDSLDELINKYFNRTKVE